MSEGALSRRLARLAATQALYQMEVTSADANDVLPEFEGHRLEKLPGASGHLKADKKYFRSIVRGVVSDQTAIDKAITRHLTQTWSLDRLDSTLRAILRSATYELIWVSNTPSKVIINEYMEICHAFFGDEERKFANGVMDSVARDARPADTDLPDKVSDSRSPSETESNDQLGN